ncbi:hypothetical protein GCM10009789_42950 [Kribbella sancticallisti]|uniref:Uncharacterized protein n=1 Tax=Kribbella sancticallisti TaxID=460087 RepID=A0ABP4PL77_9ACTN
MPRWRTRTPVRSTKVLATAEGALGPGLVPREPRGGIAAGAAQVVANQAAADPQYGRRAVDLPAAGLWGAGPSELDRAVGGGAEVPSRHQESVRVVRCTARLLPAPGEA